ncbi:hypothetical protein MBH78_04800 [Oceanimonas sp. NS1]|nr:hypothetical protein [Oceanimonas sp. NS1]
MNIIITGGAGFLGQRVAKALLQQNDIAFERLTLADVIEPSSPSPTSGCTACAPTWATKPRCANWSAPTPA